MSEISREIQSLAALSFYLETITTSCKNHHGLRWGYLAKRQLREGDLHLSFTVIVSHSIVQNGVSVFQGGLNVFLFFKNLLILKNLN